MTDLTLSGDIIKILLVLVLSTAAFIITQRSLSSLFGLYTLQSFLMAVIAVVLFSRDGALSLLFIAILTMASKVIFIPVFLRRLLLRMPIKRDLEYRYLTAVGSIILSTALLILVYWVFSALAIGLRFDTLTLMGAVIGVTLTLSGMMVIASRKQVITKVIGYLTMENGVLIFSLFVAEMPFIIEVLIIVDLLMIIVLSALLAFGIDSSIEAFHKRLAQFGLDFED